MSDDKPTYTKSTAQLDLERRLGDDSVPVYRETTNPDPATEDGFVGVDTIYQNAANKYEEPLAAKSGAEKKAEKLFLDAYGDGAEPSDDLQAAYDGVTHGAQSTGADQSATDQK